MYACAYNIHYHNTKRNRSENFIDFLKMLDARYPDTMKLIIILDNLGVHSSVTARNYLKKVLNRFEIHGQSSSLSIRKIA